MSQTTTSSETINRDNILDLLEKVTHAIEVIQDIQVDVANMKDMLEKHNLNPQAHSNIRLNSSNIIS